MNSTGHATSLDGRTHYLSFLWAGLLKHGQTGGVAPSQQFLVARMIAPIPKDYNGRIVELGSGTGALTLRLAVRCPRARILACEINPVLATRCRDKVVAAGLGGRVQVFAAPADTVLSGLTAADYVISGIPLANLHGNGAAELLDAVSRTLGRAGMYIQFQHSLLDRGKIRARFPNTRISLVALNFPPAFVYYAQK